MSLPLTAAYNQEMAFTHRDGKIVSRKDRLNSLVLNNPSKKCDPNPHISSQTCCVFRRIGRIWDEILCRIYFCTSRYVETAKTTQKAEVFWQEDCRALCLMDRHFAAKGSLKAWRQATAESFHKVYVERRIPTIKETPRWARTTMDTVPVKGKKVSKSDIRRLLLL